MEIMVLAPNQHPNPQRLNCMMQATGYPRRQPVHPHHQPLLHTPQHQRQVRPQVQHQHQQLLQQPS